MIFKIKKILKDLTVKKPIVNLYNDNCNKKVLISYITSPFNQGVKKSHSNQTEALKIATIFRELKYQVDIFEFTHEREIDFKQYNVIFGIGLLYEESLFFKNIHTTYISYSTGAYFCFANSAEIKRLEQLYNRKSILLKPKRFIKNPTYLASQMSDAMIITGNDWTISTYINSKMPILKVPVSVYDISWKGSIKKDFRKIKKNFLWFGSSGLVHKGLDLCLEVFKNLKDYNLYICGPQEGDFFKVYKEELNLPHIHYLGFVDIESYKFKEIVEKCTFSIFPSCSEGQSGSVLTTMSVGLIPIVTKEVGVDIEDKGFYVIADLEKIKQKVIQVSDINKEELHGLSEENMKFIEENHLINNFMQTMRNNLIEILGEKNG